MNILRFLSYFAKILSVNRVKSSISQNLFLKMYSSSMAFETECISRPHLGMSADVPDIPSRTSLPKTHLLSPIGRIHSEPTVHGEVGFFRPGLCSHPHQRPACILTFRLWKSAVERQRITLSNFDVINLDASTGVCRV